MVYNVQQGESRFQIFVKCYKMQNDLFLDMENLCNLTYWSLTPAAAMAGVDLQLTSLLFASFFHYGPTCPFVDRFVGR